MNMNISRNCIIRYLMISLVCLFPFVEAAAVTPAQAIENARKKISSASSISADFKMKVQGQNVAGKLVSKGNKFAITSNATSNWYNGTDLYTYVPSRSETTIFRPTASELAEVNPLLYIKSAGNYKAVGSKTKKAGVETVVLLPKTSGSGIKSVTIDLDASTFLPKSIKVATSSGGVIDLTISNLKLNAGVSDSYFTYPKSKYPKAKLIDMR